MGRIISIATSIYVLATYLFEIFIKEGISQIVTHLRSFGYQVIKIYSLVCSPFISPIHRLNGPGISIRCICITPLTGILFISCKKIQESIWASIFKLFYGWMGNSFPGRFLWPPLECIYKDWICTILSAKTIPVIYIQQPVHAIYLISTICCP